MLRFTAKLRPLRAFARRLATGTAPPTPKVPRGQKILWNRLTQGAATGLAIGLAWGFWERHSLSSPRRTIISEDAITLQPPTDSPPFPVHIEVNGTKFRALGVGVRTVTFLNFHVYAVGLYVADDDIRKLGLAPTITDSIDSGIRYAVRIVPVRNTDYGHLRDGFVRSILHHPLYKDIGHTAEFTDGLTQLKQAFGRKGKVPKGDVITFTRERHGDLNIWYSKAPGIYEPMGHVDAPGISRIFFLNYLGIPHPISPTLAESTIEGLAHL